MNQCSSPDFALLGERGRPALIREETCVSLAPEAAFGGQPAIAGTLQVNEKFAILVDHGADGHRDDDVLATSPVLALGGAVLAVGGSAKGVILEIPRGKPGCGRPPARRRRLFPRRPRRDPPLPRGLRVGN